MSASPKYEDQTFANDTTPWPAPIPFTSIAVQPFPVDALPAVLAEFVQGISTALQVPPDMVAPLVLAVCGAGVAGKFSVSPKSGWNEQVNLYACVIAPPAEKKTPVFDKVTAPVQRVERELFDKYRASEKVRRDNLAAAKRAMKTAEKEEDASRISELQDTIDANQPTLGPRLFTGDVTMERLAGLLSENGGRMLLADDEGGPFRIMAGRYSGGDSNFEVLLKGHAGSALRVDRKIGQPIMIDRATMTVALAVQPGVIKRLAKTPEFRSHGLLARFMFSWPESFVGLRDLDPPPCPTHVLQDYDRVVAGLFGIPATEGDVKPPYIRYSREARSVLLEFERLLEPELKPDGSLGDFADWAGKSAGLSVRLAGVLHAVDHVASGGAGMPWEATIGVGHALAGIAIVKWATRHAARTLAAIGGTASESDAVWLASRLPKLGPRFSDRDVLRRHGRRLRTTKAVLTTLECLSERGYVRYGADGWWASHPGLAPTTPTTCPREPKTSSAYGSEAAPTDADNAPTDADNADTSCAAADEPYGADSADNADTSCANAPPNGSGVGVCRRVVGAPETSHGGAETTLKPAENGTFSGSAVGVVGVVGVGPVPATDDAPTSTAPDLCSCGADHPAPCPELTTLLASDKAKESKRRRAPNGGSEPVPWVAPRQGGLFGGGE